MKTLIVLIIVCAIIICIIFANNQENYLSGVSPGFDPSTRASISGIGPMPDQSIDYREDFCGACL